MVICNSCNNIPHARVYISGKSLLPMLQLIYFTWGDTPASVGKYRITLQVYLYWVLLISIMVNDVRAMTDP